MANEDSFEEGLNKLKALRSSESPEDNQENEVQDVSEDAPPELEVEAIAETEEAEELEEDVNEAEEASDDELDTFLYEIDGKEYTQEAIKEALEGNLRLSDYTRKTQGVAEDRKTVEAEREKIKDSIESLQSHIDLLADMTDSEFADIDWDELRDTDTAEYLKLKERKEGKQGRLDKAKAKRAELLDLSTTDQRTAGNKELMALNPNWVEAGSPTKAYEADQKILLDYVTEQKFSQEEINLVLTSGKMMQALINSAKLGSLKSKADSTLKKVKKAPVVVRGKKASVTSVERQIQEAQERAKESGSMKDAQALMKLQRQLK